MRPPTLPLLRGQNRLKHPMEEPGLLLIGQRYAQRAMDVRSAWVARSLFDVDYTPENFPSITAALQSVLADKSAADVYDYFVREKANNKWVLQDGYFRAGQENTLHEEMYPQYYRFAWRMDDLFSIVDAGPIGTLERVTDIDILSLDDLIKAMNANIDTFKATGKLAAFKIGIAYQRDLVINDSSAHDADRAFSRIRNRKVFYDGIQQNSGAVNAQEARPLADYLFHCLMQRANDQDIPVQIHTGYLAGNWGSLGGTKALNLIPIFEKYDSTVNRHVGEVRESHLQRIRELRVSYLQ